MTCVAPPSTNASLEAGICSRYLAANLLKELGDATTRLIQPKRWRNDSDGPIGDHGAGVFAVALPKLDASRFIAQVPVSRLYRPSLAPLPGGPAQRAGLVSVQMISM